eukprot:Nk52_evm1s1015 gene=Nk52_evmTU1s1015
MKRKGKFSYKPEFKDCKIASNVDVAVDLDSKVLELDTDLTFPTGQTGKALLHLRPDRQFKKDQTARQQYDTYVEGKTTVPSFEYAGGAKSGQFLY